MANDKIRVKVKTAGVYNVYKFENGQVELLAKLEQEKRPKEAELAKEHGVQKVIVVSEKPKTETYEMEKDFFLEHATKIETVED